MVNIDLLDERKTLSFNQELLAELIWGSRAALERHRRISRIFARDPVLKNSHHYYDMTREEKFEVCFKKLNR